MARIKTDKDITKKEVILNAASNLFRQRGYKAASMRDLAEKIGIEAASLYNHIRSKSELLYDICFNTAAIYNDYLESVESSKEPYLKKVELILRFQINQMIDNFDDVVVADREWVHLDDAYLSNYQAMKHNYRKRINQIITKGIEAGEIKEINVPSTIWLLLHAINGIESWHRSKTQIPPEELEENMISILIGGMRKID
ncbi:MAG TPA: TetR/AcrR family transcriptional regulator [Arachidicoccus sp.]|nr:TetR/AcrR family transcriptional regulator [Arachidicoccus sp.]